MGRIVALVRAPYEVLETAFAPAGLLSRLLILRILPTLAAPFPVLLTLLIASLSGPLTGLALLRFVVLLTLVLSVSRLA